MYIVHLVLHICCILTYIVHMVMHIGICNALEVHIGEYTAYRMHMLIKCFLVIIYEDAILVN